MTLYFRNNEDELEPIGEVNPGENIGEIIRADLRTRRPDFTSYYMRMWNDDNDDIWIDYGSHTEFYMVKKE